jgi:hypothetical protein
MAQKIAPGDGQLVRDLGGDKLGVQVAVQVVDGEGAMSTDELLQRAQQTVDCVCAPPLTGAARMDR